MSRTLYLCEMAGRPATFALETMRGLMLSLVDEAVRSGRWEARSLLAGGG